MAKTAEASTAEVINFSLKTIKTGSPGERFRASEELVKVGTEAIPLLIEVLTDDDESVRETAVWALGRIKPSMTQVVPALTEALLDESNQVREKAAYALEALGTPEALAAIENR